MAAAPAEKKKAKWGYTDSKGKKVTALQDMTDGGGYGGSGGAYATMSNEQYRSLKGPERGTTKPAGFYRQGPEGKGEHLTGLRGVMANPVYGGLLGLLTGGPMGAAMGFGGQSIRNDVRAKGGLLNALGAGQQQASQQQVGLGSSPRPQIRPANLASPQVASPYAAEDLAMSQQVLPYGPQPMPLSTMGQIPPDIMATTINPAGVPFNNIDGAIGALGPKVRSNAPNGMPPRGMSDQMYSSWLRNQRGAVNVDNMTPEGLRYMYENYRNSPAFQ